MKAPVTLFIEALGTVDFSYLDAKQGLLGESWFLDVELTGDLNDESMIFDFSAVKKEIKACVDACIDHKLLVPMGHAAFQCEVLADEPGQLRVHGMYGQSRLFEHQSPAQAVVLIDASEISPESVIAYLDAHIRAVLPANVTGFRVHFRQEVITGAWFQYSHGLKKHAGNCQRIAHGHRSRLQVWVDGECDESLALAWCQRWQGIYLITREDIVAEIDQADRAYYVCAYQSGQGAFHLQVEQARCEVMDVDSTIECIAQFIAEQIAQAHPDRSIKVRVYEGIHKGAIAYGGI